MPYSSLFMENTLMGKTFKRNSKERFKKNYRNGRFDPFKKIKKDQKTKSTTDHPPDDVIGNVSYDDNLE